MLLIIIFLRLYIYINEKIFFFQFFLIKIDFILYKDKRVIYIKW
jgi:hypothetical protein